MVFLGVIYQKDNRSGITYVYENKEYWDSEKKQSRSKRALIGRLIEETGDVIPTDGRCKKLNPTFTQVEIPTLSRNSCAAHISPFINNAFYHTTV